MMQTIHQRIEQVSVQIRDDIYVESYLLRGDRNILIDTGIIPAPERDILPALKDFGLGLSDISLILNTHGHPDHTGGNARVKAAGGAQVCIHKGDQPFLDDRDRIFELYSAPVFKAMGSDVLAEKQAFLAMAGPSAAPDRQLKDGDVIDAGLGIQLKVLHIPGHSLGSVGFFWEEEGVLFSGDAVSGLHIEGGKLPIIHDLTTYRKSLQRLQEMSIRVLLCGHRYRGTGLATTSVRQGGEVGQFLQQSLEVAERIDGAVLNVAARQHEKGFMELADEIIAQLPREMGFMPITRVEMPHLSAQSIFFRLQQLGQRDMSEDPKKADGNSQYLHKFRH
jgi:glyoxylase-like metal-dependent hydrolase (beta-lactamase superfamily II)